MADVPVKNEPEISFSGFTSNLEQLVSSSSVAKLEAGVQVGLRLLEHLKAPLSDASQGNPQAAQWLPRIQQLEEKAKPTRTVVGVVGVTGAGKSSIINAVLDEERLVPTSGIRACTASATEISYNHSDDPNELYRAEVEFVSVEEWFRELKILLEDLIDSTGNVSRDCNNPDTEAGLAYSKIKAVYPHFTREKIARHVGDPSAMVQEPVVLAVLGNTKQLRATSSPDLFNALQQYIDSKEKTSSKMEYWPLIKVVRVYCKASALSTGVVLVDLPGVQDSNAARAAVAENYIKMCHGLWITADIQRAINNKAAKQLLGDSFKRQLQYDGAFSTVTFICTKADDILTAEVQESLNIEDEVGDYWEQIDSLRQKRDQLKVQIEDLKTQKSECKKRLDDLAESSDRWDDLLDKLGKGEPVYRPSETSKKRKRKTSRGRRHGARGSVNESSDSDDTDSSDDSSDREGTQATQVQKTPLTRDDIKLELASLKDQKKEARKSKKSLTRELVKAESGMAEVDADDALLHNQMRSLCIQGRSNYLKASIKQDFATGIKELDQDLAIEKDEANFDPDVEIRDYEKIEQSLPVFCVSARAYQKLAGRLEKDSVQIDGFTSLNDTEIPQLQEHARKMTEAGRKHTSQLFLNELNQLLNSMRLWASAKTRAAVSKKDQEVNDKVLRGCLARLDTVFRGIVKDHHSSMEHCVQGQLYKTLDDLIPVASGSAVNTATGWGGPRASGGMFWASYKAACRREGSWLDKDFNAELFEPINGKLAGTWERTFQQRIPTTLTRFAGNCKAVLDEFHRDVATNVPGAAVNPAGLSILNQLNRAHHTNLDATPKIIGDRITERQRAANRGFTPVIENAMQPAYDACARERGIGTYSRMKSTMESHVDTARHTMFRAACDAVKGRLDSISACAEQLMTIITQNLLTNLQRDYHATLVGGPSEVTAAVPLAEQMLHSQVRPILEGADGRFAELCFPPATGGVSAATIGASGQEEDDDLIARQLEDESKLDTKP